MMMRGPAQQATGMTGGERLSEQDYQAFVLSGPGGTWELHAGRLVEKQALSGARGTVLARLARQLLAQLDAADFQIRINDGHVRAPADTILIPDLLVAPATTGSPGPARTLLTIYVEPAPLIVEVWTPPGDGYDVDVKIAIYQQRGDLEIWRIHPAERVLTTWVRQPEGTYVETIYQSGSRWPLASSGTPGRDPRYHA
jgi:Uma2 family endonuclease